MKKNLFQWSIITVCIIIVMATGLMAREKTEKMGDFTWFTETTPWEEILQTAQKTDKPVLVVFCASWLDVCDEIRKTVFMAGDFKQIADQVVLVYIEQSSVDGEAYCQKFNVKVFPTFKLFSTEGFMLDNGTFKRTVEGFSGWIKEVKSGNNFYELSKQLEKNPNDRHLLIKIVERMGMSDKKDKLAYLKRAAQITPDYKDEIAQKVYEKMAWVLVENIPRGPNREEFFKYNKQLFQNIVNAYYPDKFKYDLKGNDGLVTIMNWYLQMGDREKVLSIFNDFMKRKGNAFDLIKDFDIISWATYAYFDSGNIAEVEKWAAKVKNAVKPSEDIKKDFRF
ncbi:MAG TPA: thioredoxin family protein, partial [Candidatus Kapabacteria bacterium]|nr:thioredoxin family protein [Candidatus Kapabacteria bacterium]